ncbi:transposase [Streptomyces adustus]|uniref:transposase n=1 Tax=Streptomyces adustus TaxID=1609272 RepID=UPI003717E1A5
MHLPRDPLANALVLAARHTPLLRRIRVPPPDLGRPHCRPNHAVADKTYSSRGFRSYLRRRGIAHTVPKRSDQQQRRHNRGLRGGRPPALDRQIDRGRNIVEHCSNRLKGLRCRATRYDKTATTYEAAVSLASFLLWARAL